MGVNLSVLGQLVGLDRYFSKTENENKVKYSVLVLDRDKDKPDSEFAKKADIVTVTLTDVPENDLHVPYLGDVVVSGELGEFYDKAQKKWELAPRYNQIQSLAPVEPVAPAKSK